MSNIMCFYNILDINECIVSAPCHTNADCTDTIGSFVCNCKTGFTGDGFTCTGKRSVYAETFAIKSIWLTF